MRKFLTRTVAMILLLSMFLSISAYAQDAKVTGSDVNVRSGPSSSYGVIDCLAKDTIVTVTDRSDSNWYQISYNGRTGYIYSYFLSMIDGSSDSYIIDGGSSSSSQSSASVSSASGTPGQITAMYVRFRSGPGTDYGILGTYSTGTSASILSSSNGWTKCIINGQEGYVYSDYVQANGSAAVTPAEPEQTPEETPAEQEPETNNNENTAEEASGVTGYISGDNVNFRSGPSSSYSIIGAYDRGTKVIVTGEANGWKACVIDGHNGFVYAQYVSSIDTSSGNSGSTSGSSSSSTENDTPTQPVVVPTTESGKAAHVTGNDVNFRSGPSSSYSILGCYSTGKAVTLKGETNGWANVTIDDRDGYMFASYVALDSASGSSSSESSQQQNSNTNSSSESAQQTTEETGTAAYVTGDNVNFRSGPSSSYSIIGSYNKGTKVTLFSETNGWSRIRIDGNTGYMFSSYVSTTDPNAAPAPAENENSSSSSETQTPINASSGKEGIITGNYVRFRSAPNTSSQILGTYNYGQSLTILGTENGWTKCVISGTTGYVYSDYVKEGSAPSSSSSGTANTTNVTGQDIVDFALQFKGYRYVWGGTSPSGFDCSGFVQYVYKNFGITLKRVAADQATEGTLVTGNLQPGDILAFYTGTNYIGHVGIYIGGGQFIHASSSTTGVIISELSGWYTERGYIARRIVG